MGFFRDDKNKKSTKPSTVDISKNANSRVDMSLVFARLKALSTQYAIQKGKVAIYKELQNILDMFTSDKDFMNLLNNKDK